MAPAPTDSICDPVCGTAGFLVAASDYLWTHHQRAWTDEAHRANLRGSTFHGYDFDPTMLRIGSMNMMMHGIVDSIVGILTEITERAIPAADAS